MFSRVGSGWVLFSLAGTQGLVGIWRPFLSEKGGGLGEEGRILLQDSLSVCFKLLLVT